MPLELTDTSGERIVRPGIRSILAVLDTPVNVVADGPEEYAIVHCEAAEISLTRMGQFATEARYELTGPDLELSVRHDRRESLIRLFLAACRSECEKIDHLKASLSRPHFRQLALW